MGKLRVMVPVDEIDLSAVKYEQEVIKAPRLSGVKLKLFSWILESPLFGSLIVSHVKKQNNMTELLQNTDIPETPMFKPEFPPQEPEPGVYIMDELGTPEERVASALKCLPDYNPVHSLDEISVKSFRYWKIRDYAHSYRSKLVTPSIVAENIILALKDFDGKSPPCPLLISSDVEDIRKQAAASTQRFSEGKEISVLDGIFVAIKDDIDCLPHPTKGATTWMNEVRSVKEDAVSVCRLRSCGVIFVGKANMHELGIGTTGNNPTYGTARNPHDPERYTGGSSSGPAAIVASGLCSAALGTDGGGSIRIPSSLCGVVGMKTTYGRTDMKGSLCEGGTVEIIGPIASSVEDLILVYAAMLGSSPLDRISLHPSPPCFPKLSAKKGAEMIGSFRLGKYTPWFNDVKQSDVLDKCVDALSLLSKTHGCEMVEILIPELPEMRTAHLATIGADMHSVLSPHMNDGKSSRLTYETLTSDALFRSFTGSEYVSAQRLRRRIMYHHMEIFKNVDVIVTPTTGTTAPLIPRGALKYGESDMKTTGYLMRFITAPNLIGLPAISVPVGYDNQGLPVGLQLIGRPWGEATILRLAFAIQVWNTLSEMVINVECYG
ncbi:Fatty acid amide hydrolase [Linum perenne]